ncbi:hypothetical protein ACA910_019658 [Epithemia clementina (nom. ined.)]
MNRYFVDTGYSVALWAWLHLIFLSPLKDEAKDMDLRQLDPTDIVLIPIPLERLFQSSCAIGFVTVTTSASVNMVQKLRDVAQLTILAALAMFISGASPFENISHTILAALFLAALILLDLPFDKATTNDSNSHDGESFLWRIAPSSNKCSDNTKERHLNKSNAWSPAKTRAHCTVVVTVLCQILLLYDRGWQVQRWPVPTILGSAIGWTIGVIISIFLPWSFTTTTTTVNTKQET